MNHHLNDENCVYPFVSRERLVDTELRVGERHLSRLAEREKDKVGYRLTRPARRAEARRGGNRRTRGGTEGRSCGW